VAKEAAGEGARLSLERADEVVVVDAACPPFPRFRADAAMAKDLITAEPRDEAIVVEVISSDN